MKFSQNQNIKGKNLNPNLYDKRLESLQFTEKDQIENIKVFYSL